jgi:carbon storage regulator
MLVLTRTENENLILNLDGIEITITVTKVRGKRVQLGVTAPVEVRVYRGEIYDGKVQSQKSRKEGKGSDSDSKNKKGGDNRHKSVSNS